ncbi:MAG: hypothetical protein AAFU71_19445, partial [Cyanobacteria bacterium J06632_22]
MTETTTVSYRHEVNPALATNLLNEIQLAVAEQQRQLRRVIRQIKALYAEGPVVDGWLESSSNSPKAVVPGGLRSADATATIPQPEAESTEPESLDGVDPSVLFRHGEVEDLMAYVQAMEPGVLSGDALNPNSKPNSGEALGNVSDG